MTEYLVKQDYIEEGIARGIEKGIEKGVEKGFRMVVINMKHLGKTPEEIAELTNISKNFILETLKEN